APELVPALEPLKILERNVRKLSDLLPKCRDLVSSRVRDLIDTFVPDHLTPSDQILTCVLRFTTSAYEPVWKEQLVVLSKCQPVVLLIHREEAPQEIELEGHGDHRPETSALRSSVRRGPPEVIREAGVSG